MTVSSLTKSLALPLLGFAAFLDVSAATPGGSPSYRGRDPCPAHCSVVGPSPSNWTVYHNVDQIRSCKQSIFLDFNVHDEIDDRTNLHRIRACTVWGADWDNLPASPTVQPAKEVNATYQVGWWKQPSGSAEEPVADARSLASQMQTYFSQGHGSTETSTLVFGMSGKATMGVYLGRALQGSGMANVAFQLLSSSLLTARGFNGLVMQVCEPGRDADHVFGVISGMNGTFSAVQAALQSWSRAECLGGFSESSNHTAPIFVTMPPYFPVLNTTDFGEQGGPKNRNSSTARRSGFSLDRRDECRTIKVVSGDGCASLAEKCGISGHDFMTFNPQPGLCATLQPGQHVCCSSGSLPDFTPKPNPDGSCATYTSEPGDTCHSIAVANSITVTELESFNKKTWGWNGCDNLWVGVRMCLSTGTPPVSCHFQTRLHRSLSTSKGDEKKLTPTALSWLRLGLSDAGTHLQRHLRAPGPGHPETSRRS